MTTGADILQNGFGERLPFGSVAIVHDYLNQRGGAERVVLEMAQMWPQARIYTSLYRPDSTLPEFKEHRVSGTFLNAFPVDQGFRNLFALYPAAFRSLGELQQDLVISSSSGWAHSVRVSRDSLHVVYCYTPARWLYTQKYMGASARQRLLAPLRGAVKSWDRRAARRPDLYIAISGAVRRRIKQSYGIDAPVVPPPVDVDRFTPRPRGERLLVVSRLLPYKRVDAIVDAATAAGIGLDVVGVGPALDDLRERAGPSVTFHGRLEDREVTEMIETCRAICLPGEEDFGLTPVEAQAAGKPVVAFAGGGALETVEEGVSGGFFSSYDVDRVLDAIRRCDEVGTSPEELALLARRYSRVAFRTRLSSLLEWKRSQREAVKRQLLTEGQETASR